MATPIAQEKQRAGVEDILLAILGLISGPLLWWMGQTWKSQPAASSLHTLEYWIALICALVGAALAVVWLIFLVAGLAFVLGIKTRHAALTYWSELFTPRFLRRILVSVLGAQLVFSSQAVASSEPDVSPTASQSVSESEVFMPYVESPTELNKIKMEEHQGAYPSHTPAPEPNELSSTSSEPASTTSAPSLPPQPRETSHVVVSPETTMSNAAELIPTPRQTSTIPVQSEPLPQEPSDAQTQGHRSREFTPQPVPVSPHIFAPPQNEETEQATFVVKEGDCLWDIAHYELGADATLFQIDRRWRQWWEHNTNVLGHDPHTLQPGTVLEIPPFTD